MMFPSRVNEAKKMPCCIGCEYAEEYFYQYECYSACEPYLVDEKKFAKEE